MQVLGIKGSGVGSVGSVCCFYALRVRVRAPEQYSLAETPYTTYTTYTNWKMAYVNS